MRLMRSNYSTSHVPGKDLVTADTLSRAPMKPMLNQELEEEINLLMDNASLQSLAFDKRSEEISARQRKYPLCKKLSEYSEDEWPDVTKMHSSIRVYWSASGAISLVQGLLLKGSQLIIPSTMQLEIRQTTNTKNLIWQTWTILNVLWSFGVYIFIIYIYSNMYVVCLACTFFYFNFSKFTFSLLLEIQF